jgi:hypothetical protein
VDGRNVYQTTTAGLDRVARFFIDLLNWIFVLFFFLYGIIAFRAMPRNPDMSGCLSHRPRT